MTLTHEQIAKGARTVIDIVSNSDIGRSELESLQVPREILDEAERLAELRCLDGPDDCSGAVEYRAALSSTGKSFPRCDSHWSKRLDVQDGINARYPDSPIPPADFDPSYAGESWDED